MRKIEKAGGGNLGAYFQASLSLEIIYTILNGVVQQLENHEKSFTLNKSTKEIKKIQSLERSLSSVANDFGGMDYFVEQIYKMDNQQMKNLDQLNNHEILTAQSKGQQVENIRRMSMSAAQALASK